MYELLSLFSFSDDNIFRIVSLHVGFWSVMFLELLFVGFEHVSVPASSRISDMSCQDVWEEFLAELLKSRRISDSCV